MMKRLDDSDLEEKVKLVMRLIDELPEPRKTKVKEMMTGPIGEIFFTAPASTRDDHHSAYPGGLLVHSLNVVSNLHKLAQAMCPGKYDKATLIFVGLFHDLGKVGDGENEYYVPKNSDWHNKQGIHFEVNKKCLYMPTSERGLFLLQMHGIEVTPEEFLAIRLNDGMYDEANLNYRMKEPELAILVHWADRWSTQQEKIANSVVAR